MSEWWDSLNLLQQVLWGMAIPSTLIFLVQLILSFMGGGEDDDFSFSEDLLDDSVLGEGELSESGGKHFFGVFTLKNIVSFMMGFSWGGIVYIDNVITPTMSGVVGTSITCGILLVAANMGILYSLSKLKDSGNFEIHSTIGKIATVGLSIPAENSGQGKVTVAAQGRTMELYARTEGEGIPRGKQVQIVGYEGSVLFVKNI